MADRILTMLIAYSEPARFCIAFYPVRPNTISALENQGAFHSM